MKAYADRRRDDFHLLGRVVNLAMTNPKKMEELFGEGARQAGENVGVSPDADYEKWWGEEEE